jgi:radical SAM protein with 4Fe4S-binding SPASM domain
MVNVGHTSFDWLDLNAVRLKPEEVAMLTRLKDAESLEKIHPECPEVFDKLSVNWDGKVTACCMDSDNLMVIGNILEQPIADVWTNEPMTHYRQVLADMRHDDLDLCRNCWDTHSLSKPGATKA